jgi:hypothetical protein
MAFRHGKNTKVLFGAYDLSSYFNEASSATSIETGETTTFGKNSKTYLTGLADGTISLSGLFDGDANAVDAVLSATLGTDAGAVITVAPEGLAIGSRLKAGATLSTSYEISSPVADVVSVSGEAQVTGDTSHAVSLHNLTAETATGNATSNDNSASSANGGIAILHVTANSMNAGTTIKVQHSADNSTWADLATFAAVSSTTTTSERVAVAAGTTVNRYLRASWTAAGTGSITFHVNFSRN